MGFFKSTGLQCAHYPKQWERVFKQIQGWNRSISRDIGDPLEAKALYVCTVARRLTRAAYWLNERKGGWKPVFLEAIVLLFPMIELVGCSRIDHTQAKSAAVSLWAGLHFLRDPTWLPVVPNQNPRDDRTKLHKWEIGHLISLRHYLLHGSKQVRYRGDLVAVDDIVNYELPDTLVTRVEESLPCYWNQLVQDGGSQGWIERLAQADIRPLKLQASNLYEEGMVDPDIVDCLEGRESFLS